MRRTAAVGTVSTVLAALAAGCGGEEVRGRGDPAAGKVVFTDAAEPGCGRCHTLADAEAEGTIGPNLDFLRPGYQQVLDAVREGPGFMPSYEDGLDENALHDVAAYVSEAAGE